MRIVILDGYTLNPGDNSWDGLQPLGDLGVFDRTSPPQVLDRARDADILVINKVRIGPETLDVLPQLKYITVTATGFDCVDAAAARLHNIPVSNVPVYGTDSVAQFVFALLLHICHRVDVHDLAVRNDEWAQRGDFSFWKSPLIELADKTMGIVGFGRIGKRVGELAHAFGMEVLANTRTPSQCPGYEPFAWCPLEELVERADVISLHCPLTPRTRNLVNQNLLSRCKPTTILINASRGGLVVEQDLAQALNQGHIAAAAVDVVSTEPIEPDNRLLTARNCFITPHMAWATVAARRRLMAATVANVEAFLSGTPINVVN